MSAEYLTDELMADAREAYLRREASLGEGPDGEPLMRELERRVLLSVLDRRWREHLYEMDYLQEGIGLRGYGQRDPLVEYQREAFDMFGAMMDGIKEESVGFLFYAEVNIEDAPQVDENGVEIVDVSGDEGIDSVDVPRTAGGGPTGALPAAPAAPATAQDEERAKVANVLGAAFAAPSRPANLQYTAPDIDAEDGVEHHAQASSGSAGSGYANVSRNAPCPCGSGRKFKRCHGAPQGA
jgi:preprotein translocase subunit SecA